MSNLRFSTSLLAFAALLLFQSAPGLADHKGWNNARDASKRSVGRIYSGKSWFWKDGVGYFRRGGKFYAYAGKGRKASYAKGAWAVYRKGKLCFSGRWHAADGSAFNVSCFYHKKRGRTIYQRRAAPYAKWYKFKHARTRKSDEYKKIVRGDYATRKVHAIVRRIESKGP